MKNYKLNLSLMTNSELIREIESVGSLAKNVVKKNGYWYSLYSDASFEAKSRGLMPINYLSL